MIPMTFNSAEVTDLNRFIDDDSFVIEQKLDGTRCIVVLTHGEPIQFLGRGGKPLTHTASTQHFAAIADSLKRVVGETSGEVILDGEIMFDTGIYHIFDVPVIRFGGVSFIEPEMPFYRRRQMLATMIRDSLDGPAAKVVSSHVSRTSKAEIVHQVAWSNGEGFIVKGIDSPYEPGARVSHSLKIKYVKTADVIVNKVDRPDPKHGSFSFHVLNDEGKTVSLGKCSAIGKPHVEVGDVIEVAYLSWNPGGALVQPRMMRVREDKLVSECLLDQFTPYSKAVI